MTKRKSEVFTVNSRLYSKGSYVLFKFFKAGFEQVNIDWDEYGLFLKIKINILYSFPENWKGRT